MNTKIIKSTFVPKLLKKDSLNSERNTSTNLDELLGRLKKRFGRMMDLIHPFREIYCIKQPR